MGPSALAAAPYQRRLRGESKGERETVEELSSWLGLNNRGTRFCSDFNFAAIVLDLL